MGGGDEMTGQGSGEHSDDGVGEDGGSFLILAHPHYLGKYAIKRLLSCFFVLTEFYEIFG